MALSIDQSGDVTSDYTGCVWEPAAAGKAVQVKVKAGATNNVVLVFDTRDDLAKFIRELQLAANEKGGA